MMRDMMEWWRVGRLRYAESLKDGNRKDDLGLKSNDSYKEQQ